MALSRDTTAENIKPLKSAIIRRATLGATVAAGEAITLQSDGFWDPSDASAVQLQARVAVQAGVSGDEIDSITHGPIKSITGATIGGLIYLSDTAGEISHTAGTKSTVLGYAESAVILFVQPQIVDFT